MEDQLELVPGARASSYLHRYKNCLLRRYKKPKVLKKPFSHVHEYYKCIKKKCGTKLLVCDKKLCKMESKYDGVHHSFDEKVKKDKFRALLRSHAASSSEPLHKVYNEVAADSKNRTARACCENKCCFDCQDSKSVLTKIRAECIEEMGDMGLTVTDYGRYYISGAESTWYFAEQFCRSRGLDLAAFETKEELYALNGHLPAFGRSNYWTGANSLLSPNMFTYVHNGEVMRYKQWYSLYPTPTPSILAGCVALLNPNIEAGSMILTICEQFTDVGFICEVQQPCSTMLCNRFQCLY